MGRKSVLLGLFPKKKKKKSILKKIMWGCKEVNKKQDVTKQSKVAAEGDR